MTDNNYQMVRASPLAAELTDDQCRELAKVVQRRKLANSEVLIQEGHIDNSLHVIISGMLAVVKQTAGQKEEETLHFLKEGELAGAMGFLDGTEHSATLRSLGESEVFTLKRDDFESLVTAQPVLVYKVMRAIIRTVHSIVRRMNTHYVELTNYITKQRGRY